MKKTKARLRTYTGEHISLKGSGVASQSEVGRQRVSIIPIGSGRTGTAFDRAELVGKYPTGLEND